MTDWTPSSNSTGFNCAITGESLQCSDPQSGNHIIIPTEDILCILPKNDAHSHGYSMLFLQKDTSSPDAIPQVDRIPLKSAPDTILSRHLLTEIPSQLSSRLHVIVSTASGTGTAKLLFSCILQRLLAQIGLSDYEVHETESAQTITELCRSSFIPQAEAGDHQTIILLSGDGGLCDIIDTFYNTSSEIRTMPSIVLIPAGTGNAMASSIGLLAHRNAALTTLLRGRPLPIPAFAATFSAGAAYTQDNEGQSPTTDEPASLKVYGGVVASWGLHAALVADSDTVEYRKFGADRFKMAAQELLFPSDGSGTHKYTGMITTTEVDGEGNVEYGKALESEEHMYVLATLVSNLEKDFRISPKSAPLDGSMRLVRFGPMPPERAMQLLSAAYQNGRHVQEDDVMYSEIEGFKIDFLEADKRWRRVCIDGRVIVVEEGGWMEVHKEKKSLLNILLPGL